MTKLTRAPAVRVRAKKTRSESSRRWLERQLNDPYVVEAKRQGWRSRAAFKLLELDDQVKLLRPGMRVVDLGAAPGGWTQVAVQRVGSEKGKGRVVGVDILAMPPIPGAELLHGDFLDPTMPAQLAELLGGPADLVLSDMAAPTTGHARTDHLRVMGLCEAAAEFAETILAPGGAFLAKVFQGGTEQTLLASLKKHFTLVKHVKPPASRTDSPEVYVIATGFRPPPPTD